MPAGISSSAAETDSTMFVSLLTGKKGSGKTKKLIELVNVALEKSNGNGRHALAGGISKVGEFLNQTNFGRRHKNEQKMDGTRHTGKHGDSLPEHSGLPSGAYWASDSMGFLK